MIRVSYKKNFVTGPQKGTSVETTQDVRGWDQALNFARMLAEVTELFPAVDPETEETCFVTDIKSVEISDFIRAS